MVAIAVLDVDDFKTINDRGGHAVGDQVLVSLAERLERTVRHSDAVARRGGEEFCILLTDVRSDDALRSLLERVRTAFSREPVVLPDGQSLAVTCSIGGARTSALATLDSLLVEADDALDAAKRARQEPRAHRDGRDRGAPASRSRTSFARRASSPSPPPRGRASPTTTASTSPSSRS